MQIQRSLAAWTGVVLIVLSTEVVAQNAKSSTSQGNTPNGKPFQQIQSQFAAMNDRIEAMEAHIDSVESNLQTQINSINASIGGFQGWMTSVNDAITAFNGWNAANEAIIGALQATVGSLQSALVAVQTDLTALENQVAAYQNDTLENALAIQALKTQAMQLQSLINAHTGQITSVQGQIATLSQFLSNMANATCTVGQAVSGFGAQGQITCMTPSGGGGVDVQVAQVFSPFTGAPQTVVANCPLTYKAVGGGYNGAYGMSVAASYPAATSYIVSVELKPPFSSSLSLVAHAKCAK